MKRKWFENLKYRKIIKHLESKDESQYSHLDKIFKYYIDGCLEKLLDKYGFSNIRCYFQISKIGNYLQIESWFHNLVIDIRFDELEFDYSAYLSGISAEEFSESFITKNYRNDFNIENFFKDFYEMLLNDSRLNIKFGSNKIKTKKYKYFKLITLLIPTLIILVLVLYVCISKQPLKLGSWVFWLMLLFIGFYLFFDYCDHKRK